jgi:hypothetical protein
MRPSQHARQGLRAEPAEDRLRAEDVGEDVAFRRDRRLDGTRVLDAQIGDRARGFFAVGRAKQRQLFGIAGFEPLSRLRGRYRGIDGLGELLEIVRAGGRGEEQRAKSREQASKGQRSMPK